MPLIDAMDTVAVVGAEGGGCIPEGAKLRNLMDWELAVMVLDTL